MMPSPRNKGITTPIKVSHRLTALGHTGSGKSYLCRNLLELAIPKSVPIIIFDGKSEYEPTRQLDEWEYVDALPRSWEREIGRQKHPKLRRLIVRMFDNYYPDTRRNYPPMVDLWNRVWYWAADPANKIVVYLDEIQTTCDENRTSGSLHRLVTMGRVRNIGLWGGSQRPSLIPRIFLSEADHLACFRLRDQADRDRAAEIVGDEAKVSPGPGEHDFWYRGPGVGDIRPFLVHQSDDAMQVERGASDDDEESA